MSVPLLRWDAPGPYRVAFSTRHGGVSDAPYQSLNLGVLTHDRPENARENRRRLCEAVGADAERLWTEDPEVPMLKLTADCLPIAIARRNRAAGLALLHAGRLGLLEGIVEAGVAALGGGGLLAAVGPGIGPCCYEVGDEIADAYRARFGPTFVRGRNLDLWAAAERVLCDAGVASVERIDVCTACSEDFFSHRRDKGVTGRQGVIGYVA